MKTSNWFFLFLISCLMYGIMNQLGLNEIRSSFAFVSVMLFLAWFFSLLS
jgi:hypothetical protein